MTDALIADPRPSEMKQYQMFIGGEWVDSADGATFTCTDPFNQVQWASVPRAAAADVDRAVAAARAAFENPEWSGLRPLQ
ncbi:MAG: aldehyde dehydrogenase family protein, partial [Acidimicrobiales bacterium]